MKSFEYGRPQTEAEAVELLNVERGQTAVLAGGTDLVSLLKAEVLTPDRVVDVKNVESMKGIHRTDDGLVIGALTTLEDVLDSPLLSAYRSLSDVVRATPAIQIQTMGTVGGDLCHLPNCWYFRNGYGLLGMENSRSLVEAGDNRYHAIFGNSGPAKFVNASRFAPALIAWGAKVRIVGPEPEREEMIPLEDFYITPRSAQHRVTVLEPGQLLTHIWLPHAANFASATYEVIELDGLDWPLSAAACSLEIEGGLVRSARIVMGHVAPVPWVCRDAALALRGKPVTEETAQMAGEMAVSRATPLKDNEYKVQLARTAVKRSLLRAVDQLEGYL